MKHAIVVGLVLVAWLPARAQLLRPEAVNGAVLGGIAGAVIGHNSGDLRHDAWRGAALGAGAGLILGEIAGNARAAATTTGVPVPRGGGYVYRDAPAIYTGVSYRSDPVVRYRGHGYGRFGDPWSYRRHGYAGPRWGGAYRGRAPYYGWYPGYSDAYPYYDGFGVYRSGSAASAGLVLGAIAGGIIGHGSGEFRHDPWRGAAWGAGAGWLLGSIADARRSAAAYESVPVVTVPAAPAPAQPITIINHYHGASTPMSSANGLFGR